MDDLLFGKEVRKQQQAPISKEVLVDAIEEGRIVRVPETFAIREGLLVLRRLEEQGVSEEKAASERVSQKLEHVKLAPFESLRKPLRRQQNNVLASLVDNFHWVLLQKRKERNATRKHIAQELHISEDELKMAENGVLPSDDFILISKLERHYGINLRKEKVADAPRLSAEHQGKERRAAQRVHELSQGKEPKESLVGDIELAL